MEALKNKLWVFGHPTNSLKGCAGLSQYSDVSPIDGMKQLGATGIMYVPMGRPCDRGTINFEMRNVPKTGWSIESEQNILDMIEHKKEWSNITLGIFDDFFSAENGSRNYTNYPIEKLIALREKMHEAGLEMWVVFYTMQQGDDTWKQYLPLFDGVTFWFWDEPTNEEFDEKCQWFFDQTEGQKRMLGCYLYNFGQSKEATVDSVRHQLDTNLAAIKAGKLHGIILHTNAVGGMGFAAYDEAVKWVEEHGEDLV